MRMPMLAIVAVIAASLTAAACGSTESAEPPTAAPTVAVASAFNDADVSFAQGMITHHSQAVEMATLALETSTNPAIVDLATRIQGAQDPEIEQMRGWLDTWGHEEMSADMEGMDHGSGEGMMNDAEMTALSTATGVEFDTLFVALMIRHHQGAIDAANTLLTEGTDPDVRSLAEAIIAAQAGEIAEMQALALG